MSKKELIIQYVKENPPKKAERGYYQALADKVGCSWGYVRNVVQAITKTDEVIEREATPEEEVEVDRVKRTLTEKHKVTDRKYKALLQRTDELEREVEFINTLKENEEGLTIRPVKKGGESESTAVVILSDMHIEEKVDPDSINGLNTYNPDVSAERAEVLFQRVARLLEIFQKDTTITELVIACLGDTFSGTIHEELAEDNYLMPAHAAALAQSYLKGGIDFLLNNTKVKLTFIGMPGNHGRMTQKKRYGNSSGHSLERFMLVSLAQLYEGEERISFELPEGSYHYKTIYNYRIRFTHGDMIKGGYGVGGVAVPIRRAVMAMNQNSNANLTVLGHFHQLIDAGLFLVNGSMIGWNAYAAHYNFPFEEPKQTFFLVHKKRGRLGHSPIVFT